MTIEQSDQIDIVAADDEKQLFQLIISDHLSWDDANHHWSLLCAKLNAYVGYAGTKEFSDRNPRAAGKRIQIHLVHVHDQPEAVQKRLAQVEEKLKTINIDLVCRKFGTLHRGESP